MKPPLPVILTGLLALTAGTLPMRAGIDYAEPPDLARPDNVGAVSLGSNTVSGTIDVDFNPGGGPASDDEDYFDFVVPHGLVVTKVELTISNFAVTDGATAGFKVFTAGYGNHGFTSITGDTTIANLVTTPGGLPAGTHNVQFTSFGYSGLGFFYIGTVYFDWSVKITAVPKAPLEIEVLNNPTHDVQLSFTTEQEFGFRLQTATDLFSWTDLFEVTGNDSEFRFIHMGGGLDPERYYRLAKSPVGIEMVTVGNAGNAADTGGSPNPAGAVPYDYKIGIYEVTNAQYVEFLNAVAATDANNLYETIMGGRGISRFGVPGSYSYGVTAAEGNKPVREVTWYDALRFCNWLHNGQASGVQDATTTEDGAYTLTGTDAIQLPGSDPVHGSNGRNSGALFHLPSEDEWYKAAYHHPAAQGGDADDFWLYASRSNSVPTLATADEFGNIDNDTMNLSNYDRGASWNGYNGGVTTVGSGGSGSHSHYGAADIGGNVLEWNEQEVNDISPGERGLRGGSWKGPGADLPSSLRGSRDPSSEGNDTGIRVASPAP